MLSRQLGFISSWKMLTRDKGWLKPLCVLALVGWIPIVGQIVVLGYGFEWARLTAWGIDAAPKQHGVDYGKVLATGGRAFLVFMSMMLALALILGLVFRDVIVSSMLPIYIAFHSAGVSLPIDLGDGLRVGLVDALIALVINGFAMAAVMRTILYDNFAAGWRLDRICQMIGRDPGGFCKMLLVSLVGGLVGFVYSAVMFVLSGAVVAGGLLAFLMGSPHLIGHVSGEYLISRTLSMGIGPIALIVVLAVVVLFIYGIISVAMQLVAMNAAGQWFCRFEVGRWGVSADPLPDGVPVKEVPSSQPEEGSNPYNR